MTRVNFSASHITTVLAACIGFSSMPLKAGELTYLHQIPHVSGIQFQMDGSGEFLISTSSGVLSASLNGTARMISADTWILTELVRHPKTPSILLSSGFQNRTEELGVIRSEDNGKTWKTVSPGRDEGRDSKVAFFALTYSPSQPETVYGAVETFQVSHDGGYTWQAVGQIPGQVFDIAVSTTDPRHVFVATRSGLFQSKDGGETWALAHDDNRPATMVDVANDGTLRAFIFGYGLVISASELNIRWQKSETKYLDKALINIALSPSDPGYMLGVFDTGAILYSRNYGDHWASFEGLSHATPERIAAGQMLFKQKCQTCHGKRGVGENPAEPGAVDENGLYLAPALNDSAHAWHHSDVELMETILDGSPRNKRMIAWKDAGVSPSDAENLVAYIKSLWNVRSLACQGSRHTICMH